MKFAYEHPNKTAWSIVMHDYMVLNFEFVESMCPLYSNDTYQAVLLMFLL